jgi:glycosyltransferase involved in cell wall biosynthesis
MCNNIDFIKNKNVVCETIHNSKYILKYLENINLFLDMHGIAPEEELYLNNNEESFNYWNQVEEEVVKKSKYIFVVSKQMKLHFLEKYKYNNLSDDKFINIYILDDKSCKIVDLDKKKGYVYSGGIQKWQNIDEIIEKIYKSETNQLITFYSNQKKIIENKVNNKKNIIIDSFNFDDIDINKIYSPFKFGFIVRDSNILNKVACPTKLLEYIKNGIIPIINSKFLGDYAEHDFKYVNIKDCFNNLVIDKDYKSEILHNLMIIKYFEKINFENKLLIQSKVYKKKNIIIQLRSLDKGGLETVVVNLIKFLSKKYKVFVVLEIINENHHTLKEILNIKDVIIQNYKDLETIVSQNKIEVAHLHFSVFGLDLYKRNNIKTIYTIHSSYIWMNNKDVLLRKKEYDKIDKFIAVSNSVKNYFSKKFNIDSQKVNTISNGFDIDFFNKLNVSFNKNLKTIFDKKDKFIFASVASISPIKAQHHSIDAFYNFKYKNESVLLFVGNISDNKYYNFLLKKINEYNLKDNVKIINFLTQNQLKYLYNNVNCCIQCSISEGWSNTLMEYMYYQIPMIITDTGSAKELKEKIDSDLIQVVSNSYKNIFDINIEYVKNYTNIFGKNITDITESMNKIFENYNEIIKDKHYLKLKLVNDYSLIQNIEQHIKIFEE